MHWDECVCMLTYHFGHPVGSTVSVAASEPVGFSGCELGERHRGVYPKAPGTHPVWADLSVQGSGREKISSHYCHVTLNSKFTRFSCSVSLVPYNKEIHS